MSLEDNIRTAARKAKEAAEKANAAADPVVDSWLKRLSDSPLTPLWLGVILLAFLVGYFVLR